MNRRNFLLSTLATSATLSLLANSEAAVAAPVVDTCILMPDQIFAEATGFVRYEHHHQLVLPVSVLIHPPEEGFKIRTSTLDQGSLDEKAFKDFLKESGLDDSLRFHSHEVKFSKEELNRIAIGEKNVKIAVKTPMGNFGHEFFFNAPKSVLIKVKRGRTVRG